MKTTIEFLDAVKAKTGTASDYALAHILGLTKQQISKYRNRHDCLSPETAIKVANLLGIDAGIVLAAVAAERAKSDQERDAWTSIFEKLGGLAAGLVVALSLGATPTPAHAGVSDSSGLYIMLNGKRTRKQRINPNPFLQILHPFIPSL